jgi:hypothetical protein
VIDLAPLEALIELSKRVGGTLEVLPVTTTLREISYREIRIGDADGESHLVPCFDEYRDAEIGSRVVLLHLLLDACVCFEEASDYATWRADLGLHAEDRSRELRGRLTEVVPNVRAIMGSEARPIDSHSLEFGTGLAKALRASRDSDQEP